MTVAVLAIGLFQPSAVPDRGSPPPGLAIAEEMNFTVEGKITQHAGNKLTLNTEGNIIFHVIYNDKTEIKNKDGGPGSPKDLQVGARIHVDGDLQESGEIIAQKISIQPDSAGEKR
ncbi:MAG: DUF5666 domain-containing protein [Acidobacteriia bacterium]|nr:DUF5666 domain-containing protein [Terriglobia bacterium]